VLLAGTVTVLPAQAKDAKTAKAAVSPAAREHFNAGVSLLQDPDGARYEEAYQEFKTAYADSPSWKILGNLGICAMKLERDREAIDAFRRYLSEGKDQIDADERQQVERDLATLEAAMATVTFTSTAKDVQIFDERLSSSGGVSRNSYGPFEGSLELGLRPGRHRIVASSPGLGDVTFELQVGSKAVVTKDIDFSKPSEATTTTSTSLSPTAAPADESGSDLRWAAYASLGVGLLGVGAGTAFAVLSNNKYDEANSMCPSSGTCELSSAKAAERTSLGEDGDKLKTFSLVGFIVGGAGLATGTALLVWGGPSSKTEATTASVKPYLSPNGVGVLGSF
jgi:hypothetical protein